MAGPDYKECNCGWLPIGTAGEKAEFGRWQRVLLHLPPTEGWAEPLICTAYFDTGAWWDDYANLIRRKPTHWQPLPAPPLHPGRGVS